MDKYKVNSGKTIYVKDILTTSYCEKVDENMYCIGILETFSYLIPR